MFNRDILLKAALNVAKRQHYSQMTRADVAAEAGCSDSLVSRYLGDMTEVRKAVVKLARSVGLTERIARAPLLDKRNSGRNGPVRSVS